MASRTLEARLERMSVQDENDYSSKSKVCLRPHDVYHHQQFLMCPSKADARDIQLFDSSTEPVQSCPSVTKRQRLTAA